MIIPDGDIIVDPETSCTREVAVAKLLGWMQGPIRRVNILLSENGSIPEDQLATMHSLPMPLIDLLAEFRNAASRKLQEAFDAYASQDVMQEREDAVAKEDKRIYKVTEYFRAIDEELAKGEASALKTDQRTTDETGERHLWIDSVDQWARTEYGISIIDPEFTAGPQMEPPASVKASQGGNQKSAQRLRAQEQAILEIIEGLGHDPKLLPKNKGTAPGVKSAVRIALKGNALFPTPRVFEKAWQRMRDFGDIADPEEGSSP